MVLTFRSSRSEVFKIIGEDEDGSRRVAVATRMPGQMARWDLKLEHPSGQNWSGTFTGSNVLDALGELLVSKESEYIQARGRGHTPAREARDTSVSVDEFGNNLTSPVKRYL